MPPNATEKLSERQVSSIIGLALVAGTRTVLFVHVMYGSSFFFEAIKLMSESSLSGFFRVQWPYGAKYWVCETKTEFEDALWDAVKYTLQHQRGYCNILIRLRFHQKRTPRIGLLYYWLLKLSPVGCQAKLYRFDSLGPELDNTSTAFPERCRYTRRPRIVLRYKLYPSLKTFPPPM